MKFFNPESVLVVIPSMNSPLLMDAVNSVLSQKTMANVEALVVWDHPQNQNFPEFESPKIKTMLLPWNTGSNGFYGHRIYSMVGHISDHEYILFLDEDNFFEPSHIKDCLETFKYNPGLDFVHSRRNVVTKEGEFVCPDTFEAIGEDPINLVDTSTYCFRRNFLVNYGNIWNYQWGADRRFFQIVKHNKLGKYASTGNYTVNYRLDGNPGSPTKEFFLEGYNKHGR